MSGFSSNSRILGVFGYGSEARGLHLLDETLDPLLNPPPLVGIAPQLDQRPLSVDRRPPRLQQELDQSVRIAHNAAWLVGAPRALSLTDWESSQASPCVCQDAG